MGQVNNYDGEIAVFVNDEQVYVDSTGLVHREPIRPRRLQPRLQRRPRRRQQACDRDLRRRILPLPPIRARRQARRPSTSRPARRPMRMLEAGGGQRLRNQPRTIARRGWHKRRDGVHHHRSAQEQLRDRAQGDHRRAVCHADHGDGTVTNDLKGLSSAEGSVTVTGTITPGAVDYGDERRLTDVTFGQATVSATRAPSRWRSPLPRSARTISASTGKIQGYYDGTANGDRGASAVGLVLRV